LWVPSGSKPQTKSPFGRVSPAPVAAAKTGPRMRFGAWQGETVPLG